MEVIASFFIALTISLIVLLGGRNSFASVIVFFLILFLAVLSGYYWIVPFGPLFWGVAWMPLFFVGIICAFFLLIPPPSPKKSINDMKAFNISSGSAGTSIFTWLLLLLLIIAVLTGFYFSL